MEAVGNLLKQVIHSAERKGGDFHPCNSVGVMSAYLLRGFVFPILFVHHCRPGPILPAQRIYNVLELAEMLCKFDESGTYFFFPFTPCPRALVFHVEHL